MRKIIFLGVGVFLLMVNLRAQNIIFLHHSTGWGLYTEGHVAEWITSFNTTHGTSYNLVERSFPDTPYPWDNYPYDYWNLWINNTCNNSNPKIACISSLCASYDVIIFKHCYPGSAISDDDPIPSASSSKRTLANYKLQYRALRSLMDSYPHNKFIVWTLVPLHRLATNVTAAAKAGQFADWVKNDWLTEDGRSHPNIFVFDFWGYAAESNPSPVNGKVNCLKYNYEYDHNVADSHPNKIANETIGPAFAQFIVNVAKGGQVCSSDINHTGYVDGADYLMLLGKFGTSCTTSCDEDIDDNRLVDGADFLILLGQLFRPCM
jgi:hypothetical protein